MNEAELQTLAELDSDEARRRHLERTPSLADPGAVGGLIAEVNRALRVDLDEAERLAAALLWLAEELDDDDCRGFGHRARGNVLLYRREYRAASEAYRRALEHFLATGNEEEAAATRNAAVGSLHPQGLWDEALEMGLSARETFERLGVPLRLARVENNLATLVARQDRWAEALEHYRVAYGLFEARGRPSDIGITLRNIAVCLQELNEFDQAAEAYDEAQAFCEQHELPLVAFEVRYNAAYLHYVRGQYGRANALFDEARRACRALGDREHEALCDLDQAEILLELNLPDEAAPLAARACEGFQGLGMGYESAKALSYQGLAAFHRGKTGDARSLFERAAEILRGEGNRVWGALVDMHRSLVLFSEGLNAEANELARESYDTFLEVGLPSRTGLCEILLARIALASGDLAAARESCAAALARLGQLGSPALEAQAQLVAGRIEEAAGNRAEALAAYRRSHERLEELRGHLPSEDTRIAFLKDKLDVYEGLVELTLSGGRRDDARSALSWVETSKSRSLADLLAFGAWTLPTTTGAEEMVAELRGLREQLNWQYRQIDRQELEEGPAVARIESLRQDARAREARLMRVLRRLQTGDPDFRSLQGSLIASLEEIRTALPEGAVLLEFYVARGHVYAFLVDERRVRAERLASAAHVRGLQEKLRFQLGKSRLPARVLTEMAEFMENATRSYLAQLYDALLAPLAAELDCRHLVVAPHGSLHFVPFHALFDGETYLIDRFDVSYIPSGTVLHLCSRRRHRPDDRALVLGVPDRRAPQIRDEAEAVAETLPGAQLLLGEEATGESLARLGRGCRYIHIATHGLYRRDNPMFSALKLSAGRLSLFDLYGLRLQAELVVLSGCGTGLSSVEGADELVGLTRGLLYAGASAVLVSLWDVNDESIARYMRSFYRHLTAGVATAAALSRAMRELRQSHPNPYHWAPFVLVGHPGAAA